MVIFNFLLPNVRKTIEKNNLNIPVEYNVSQNKSHRQARTDSQSSFETTLFKHLVMSVSIYLLREGPNTIWLA